MPGRSFDMRLKSFVRATIGAVIPMLIGVATACTRTAVSADVTSDTSRGDDALDATDQTSADSQIDVVAVDADARSTDVPPFDAGRPCPACPPRAISPAPAAVTSLAPNFRWLPPTGADMVRVEVCAERDCTTIQWSIDVSGGNSTPATPLLAGVHFWRLTAHDATGWQRTSSAPRTFIAETRVTRRAASCAQRSDFNGDGRTDLALGIPELSGRGHLSVYLGTPAGFLTAPDFTIDAPTADPHFGTELMSLGDVDGDGFGDLLASSGAFVPTMPMYLYRGTSSGLSPTPAAAWTDPSGSAGVEYSFWANRPGGDFNGDGFADVILSAAANGVDDAAYVYYGRDTELPTAPDLTLRDPGVTPMSQFGRCTAGVGDINGDGFDDAAVGAVTSMPSGRVYVYYGSATGIAAVPSLFVVDPSLGGNMGCPIAPAGDIDADGYADMVITGMRDGRSGTVFVVRGGPGALTATRLESPSLQGGGPFGFTTRCLGDVDGDSFDDIGVPGAVISASIQTGALFVYQGSATGIRTAATATLLAPPGAPASFQAVRYLGDLDADGFDDVAVGAERLETGPDGRVFIYRGSTTGLGPSPTVTLLGASRSLIGASLARVFRLSVWPGG